MIQYLLIAVLSSLVLTLIGALLAYFLKLTRGLSSFADLLLSYVLGLYMTVIIYSMVKTTLATINLIALLVLFVAYYFASKKSSLKKPIFQLKYLLVSFLLFFSVTYLTNVSDYSDEIKTRSVTGDHHFLTNISYYINLTGQENEYHVLNLISSDYHGMTPYHYTELWANAMIADIFKLNYSFSYSLVIIPLFYLAVFLALLVLTETILGKVDLMGWTLCTSILFFFGSAIPTWYLDTLGIPFLQNLSDVDVWSSLKYAPHILFIALFLIFWNHGNFILAYLALIFMSFVQFTSLPAVIGFLILWTAFWGLFKKQTNEQKIFFLILLFSASYFIQKWILGNQVIGREGTSIQGLLSEALIFTTYLTQRVNIIIKEFIYLLVRYHVFLIIIAISWKFIISHILMQKPTIILFGISITGLLAYSILFQIVNSGQLFYVIIYTWIPIFFLLIILEAKKKSYRRSNYLICGILIFALVNVYENVASFDHLEVKKHSDQYLATIERYFSTNLCPEIIGASFRSDYGTEYSSYVTVYTMGSYLSQIKNGACTVSLSDLDIPEFEDPLYQKRSANGYKLGWFFRNVQQQKQNGSFVAYEESQVKLLKDGKFGFAIFSKEYKIPSKIHELISQIYEDPISGERFAIISENRIN